MKIRFATHADHAAIAKIHTQSWQKNYRADLDKTYLSLQAPEERLTLWDQRLSTPKDNQRVIVVDDGEQLIGFACLYTDENPRWGTYLDNLHIIDASQSKGVGTTLLNESLKVSNAESTKKGLCLLVNQRNTGAQRFYLRNGARNAEASIWDAPDGSKVPTYWFVWD